MSAPSPAWRDVFDGWIAAALDWWGQRAPRERVLLTILAALAVVTLLTFGVWRPIQAARVQARQDIRTYEVLTAQMKAAGPEAVRRAVTQSASGAASLSGGAAALGLTIRRIEPNGDRTQVVLEDAPFAVMVDWLDRVERDNGMTAVEVKVERRPTPGLVNAQITLGANG